MPMQSGAMNKPQKRDFMQEFLEQVASKSGPLAAVRMEEAIKLDKKRMNEASEQSPMLTEDFAKSMGVDLNQEVTKSMGVPQQPAPQPQAYQTKPASSPMGFGGASLQDGNVVEQQPGVIGGILATILGGGWTASASRDLEKLKTGSEIQSKALSDERLKLSEERLTLEKQQEVRRLQAERRIGNQASVNNMRYFGASVTPEMLVNNPTLNDAVTPLVKKFGITPNVNEETQEITFEIPMYKELETIATMPAEVQKKELTSMAEKLPNLDRAVEAVNSLKQSFTQGWNPESIEEDETMKGIFERARGVAAIPLQSWTQTNPNLRTYLSNIGAFASLISKGGFLEAGVLTNQDIQRVLQSLPKPGDSKERVGMAWKTIDGILGSARKQFESKKAEYSGKGKTPEKAQGTQTFNVGGKTYNIPADKVEAFKKAKGL